MTDQESFRDSIESAIECAKKTGKKYFVFCPYIANKYNHVGMEAGSLIHLVTGLVIEDAIQPEEVQDVAFTVYPTGVIRYGYVSRHEGENDAKEAT